MTEAIKTAQTRAKKSPEQALAALQLKQRALAAKAAKLQRAIDERKNATLAANRARIGKLADEAGVLDLPDEVIKAAFTQVAKAHGIQPNTQPA